MIESHEETQTGMNSESMEEVEIVAKKPIPAKSKFGGHCENQAITPQSHPIRPLELKPLK